MPCESSSLNVISGCAMIVALKITHISSEHCTTRIFSNVFSSSSHIHLRQTSIVKWWASLTLRDVESTARWTPVTVAGIQRINFLPERQLYQSYVHPTRLTRPVVRAISLPGCCISWLLLFEDISTCHLQWVPGFLSDWFHVPRMVQKTLTKYGITRWDLSCLISGILTPLAMAWNGIVQMDSGDNVSLCWLPGSESM